MKYDTKKSSRILRKITVLTVSVMLAATSLTGCRKQAENVPELLDPVTVEAGTVTVKRGDLANITYLNVTVVPKTQTLSFEGSGKVQNVSAAIGDTVTAGQTLIELDQSDLKKQIETRQKEKDQTVLLNDFWETAAYNEMIAATMYQAEAAAAYEEAANTYAKANEDYSKAKDALESYNSEEHQNKQPAEEGDSSEGAASESSVDGASWESSMTESSSDEGGAKESSTEESSTAESSLAEDTKDKEKPETSAPETELAACEQALSSAQNALAGALLSVQYANIAASKATLAYRHMVAEHDLSEMQAQKEIDRLTEQMQSAALTAPFSGKVVALFFSPGQSVEPFAPVIVIADESVKYLQAEPFDNAQLELAKKLVADMNGQEQAVTYRAYDKDEYVKRTMRGETLPACFELSDPDGVSYGETGTVLLYRGSSEDTLYIPRACLQKDDVGSYVYKEVDGRREKTYITVGLTTDSYVEVLSGLSEGEVLYEN